jgi:hypothetical protein
LRREEAGVYVRNRLEHSTDKRDRGVRVGKREEDERRKGKGKGMGGRGRGYYKKREGGQEAKACSIGWRSR